MSEVASESKEGHRVSFFYEGKKVHKRKAKKVGKTRERTAI